MEESPSPPPKARTPQKDSQILLFVVLLCAVCGLLLAAVAHSLSHAQTAAKEFDQSKQMLIAAKVLSHEGYFILPAEGGQQIPAQFDAQKNLLIPSAQALKASDDEIRQVAELRIHPLFTDKTGALFTAEQKEISLPKYIAENKNTGYAQLPLKLLYVLSPNTAEGNALTPKDLTEHPEKADAFLLPISGFGLWAPIYGFLAIKPDGDTVLGTTWYEHAETPGLGANIAEASWQKQFYNKIIFQASPDGKTDWQTADVGIIVVKGKVSDVYGNTPRAKSAVDGISGATLTGDGVTNAYRNSLSPYRPFLIRLHDLMKQENA